MKSRFRYKNWKHELQRRMGNFLYNIKNRIRNMKRNTKEIPKNIILWIKRKTRKFIENHGYVHESYHDGMLYTIRTSWEKRVEEEYNRNLDRLIDSIRTVNMIKIHLESPMNIKWFENFDPSQSVRAEYKEDYPPNSKWYQYRVAIDIPKMQRIYEELKMSQDSYELEYLKKSICRDIEQNLDALIKLELGVR